MNATRGRLSFPSSSSSFSSPSFSSFFASRPFLRIQDLNLLLRDDKPLPGGLLCPTTPRNPLIYEHLQLAILFLRVRENFDNTSKYFIGYSSTVFTMKRCLLRRARIIPPTHRVLFSCNAGTVRRTRCFLFVSFCDTHVVLSVGIIMLKSRSC